MKKICMVLVVMFIISIAGYTVGGPPKGEHYDINFVVKPMFIDAFDIGLDLGKWEWVSGTWGIAVEGTNNVCSISGGSYVGGVVATAGSEYWNDYSLEFDVKKEVGNYFNAVFRYTAEGGHYLLEPSSDSIHIALFKKVGGGGYEELTAIRPLQDTVLGEWYHYKIVVEGESIKVYVDEILKFDETDFALEAGKIGIGGYAGSTAYFDNVTVMKPNEILVDFNGTVPGLMYVSGETFAILDHDAGIVDGDAAVLQLPLSAVYDVYCSMRGHPGGVIHWGCNHVRYIVPAGKPTWHQHVPDNFTLTGRSLPCGPFPITTSNDATILALRWYPQ